MLLVFSSRSYECPPSLAEHTDATGRILAAHIGSHANRSFILTGGLTHLPILTLGMDCIQYLV